MHRLAAMLGLAMVVAVPSNAADGAAQAEIALDRTDSGVTIVGKATAASAGIYDARMTIEKSGTSGNSTSTSQGSQFDLAAGESADVARVGLNLQPGDHLKITVEISQNGQVISRSSSDLRY